MAAYDHETAEKWVDGLDDETVKGLLERAAKLDGGERRKLLADPHGFFEAAGMRVPDGVDIEVVERKLSHLTPRDLEIPGIPDLPRIFVICFRICFWIFTPWGIKQICRLICIRV